MHTLYFSSELKAFSPLPLASARSSSAACTSIMATDSGAVSSVKLEQLSLDFTGPDPLTVKISSTSLKVQLAKAPGPIPSAYPITDARENVTLIFNKIDIAGFSVPWAPAKVDNTGLLTTTVQPCDLHIPADKQRLFSDFIKSVILSTTTQAFTLNGTVDARFSLSIPGTGALGTFSPKLDRTLPGIGFSSNTSLAGLSGLAGITYIKTLELTQDTDADKSWVLKAQVKINNPSQISISVGDLSFSTTTGSSLLVGQSELKDVQLIPGDNVLTLVVTSTNINSADLYGRLQKDGLTIILEGYEAYRSTPGLSKNTVIAAAFALIQFQVKIPALGA
ncbi:hypothetical protein EC991_009178 [Linnemannia zychae]|nr:hypothetical protein EC991_009178 [Linnemannia zychae]